MKPAKLCPCGRRLILDEELAAGMCGLCANDQAIYGKYFEAPANNKPKGNMNTLEPVIAFIDERKKQLTRELRFGPSMDARIQELEMIRTLCTGLIEQDKLLKNALGR